MEEGMVVKHVRMRSKRSHVLMEQPSATEELSEPTGPGWTTVFSQQVQAQEPTPWPPHWTSTLRRGRGAPGDGVSRDEGTRGGGGGGEVVSWLRDEKMRSETERQAGNKS